MKNKIRYFPFYTKLALEIKYVYILNLTDIHFLKKIVIKYTH